MTDTVLLYDLILNTLFISTLEKITLEETFITPKC